MALDLTAIPQFARNLNRLMEIAAVLARYGLADWIARLDSKFIDRILRRTRVAPLTEATHEARIRLALTDLGTTFIKLGQMLSTRRDLIGPELANELSQLQSQLPADPFPITKATIEAELKRPIGECFATFDETAVASASIGQCHRATMPDGRKIVVKVQHPDILKRIETDLSILAEFARLAEQYLPDVRSYQPAAVVAEFRKSLLRELDFRRELRHLQLFARNFASDPDVRFPEPVPERSTSRVLTMGWLEGIPLNRVPEMPAHSNLPVDLARRGARIFLDMIFLHGFYHADPHPGNVLILEDGRIGLLDAGMVGRVDDRLRVLIGRGLTSVMANDPATLTDLIVQVGNVPPKFEPADLEAEVADQLAFYWGMPLDQFKLGTALDEMTEAIRKYRILLPAQISMLLKVLVMLEGTGRILNPSFNLAEVLQPYRRTMTRQILSPRKLARRAWETLRNWDELIEAFPRQLRDLFKTFHKQQFVIRLEHHHLEPSVNRLVFGLMTSALFVGSAFLWAYQAPPVIYGVPVMGVLGSFASAILGLRLFWAIQKSGKLEDKN